MTAAAAAVELRGRGFEVDESEPLTATFDVRDADELADLRDHVAEVARRRGGEFLGSGGFARL
jgi:hypothetical protein